MNEREILTTTDLAWLDTVRVSLGEGLPDSPRRLPKATTIAALVPPLLVDARLSEETYRKEQERLDKRERKRKALRERKPYTRKRGTVHPNKKKATRRRLLKRQWAQRPMSCLMRSGGAWSLDPALWARYIEPLWQQWLPSDLKVVRYCGYGKREKPYSVYTIDVFHKEHGKLYDGNSQYIYDICTASEASSSRLLVPNSL